VLKGNVNVLHQNSSLSGFTITQIHSIFGRTPRTRDQLVVKTSTWQKATLSRDRHKCSRWDSNHNPSKPMSADRAVTGIGFIN